MPIPANDSAHGPYVSTGDLPAGELVQGWVDRAHERYRSDGTGENSQV